MKKRKRFLLLVVILTGMAVGAILLFLRPSAAERMKADIRSQIPIGSTRQQVGEFMQSHNLQANYFDYPSTDPRSGTFIDGYGVPTGIWRTVYHTCSWLKSPFIHVVFIFDRKGEEGKLMEYRVTDKHISILP